MALYPAEYSAAAQSPEASADPLPAVAVAPSPAASAAACQSRVGSAAVSGHRVSDSGTGQEQDP